MIKTPAERGLLDTSTLILLGRIADPADLPRTPMISAITLAELSVGPLVASSDAERAARQAHLQQAESDFDAVPFDAAAARAFGGVAASLRAQGRTTKARAYDALIAASAIALNVPLYTCNPRDFEGIDGLDVRKVPHPDH
ncbi:MAG: type II toxin-antitoxin system VapC family toxin [Demequina sp.]|nr:type II toxin-antitoxin system VapC family toxin [Demequina sp.]